MQRVIEVTISPDGETRIETKGYSGSDCLQASRFLEEALGVPSTQTKTAEYFQSTSTEQHVQEQ